MAINGSHQSSASDIPESQPPHKTLLKYHKDEAERKESITEWFDKSAHHYDAICQEMFFGTGDRYRRQALLRGGVTPGMTVLDVGCGTGIMSAIASKVVGPGGTVIGIDPSLGMLREGVYKNRLPKPAQGTAEDLPICDDSMDFVCMVYALRHVSDLKKVFLEFKRVLKPGGSLFVVEITSPASAIYYSILKIYLKYFVPTITRLTTKNQYAQTMMSYYWDTIDQCVAPEIIMTTMERAGLVQVMRHSVLGIFSEYSALKL